GLNSGATAVSTDGAVVVGQGSSTSGPVAFRWTQAGGMVGLNPLPGAFASRALGVSPDGSVVVGASRPRSIDAAFRWTASTGMTELAAPPVVQSRAMAASGGCVVVGSEYSGPVDTEAFIWDTTNGLRILKNVLINDQGLDLTGWTLTEATAITPDGLTIVGFGTNPVGEQEAWIAVLSGAFQTDQDADGAVTVCDNCPAVPNADQADSDGNGVGDACALCLPYQDDDG